MKKMTKRDEYELLTRQRLSKIFPLETIDNLLKEFPIKTGLNSFNQEDRFGWITDSKVLMLYRTAGGKWVNCSTKTRQINPKFLWETKNITKYCKKPSDRELSQLLKNIAILWLDGDKNNIVDLELEEKIKKYFGNNCNSNQIKEQMGVNGIKAFKKWFQEQDKNKGSFGEYLVSKALSDLSIPFSKEFEIKELEGKLDWIKCPRFDFVIYKNGKIIGAIEYDGIYHENDNLKTTARDCIKNFYAIQNYPFGILRISKEYLNLEIIKEIIINHFNYGKQ